VKGEEKLRDFILLIILLYTCICI